jgi:hypothetical protein
MSNVVRVICSLIVLLRSQTCRSYLKLWGAAATQYGSTFVQRKQGRFEYRGG